jgi:hypothetical protein
MISFERKRENNKLSEKKLKKKKKQRILLCFFRPPQLHSLHSVPTKNLYSLVCVRAEVGAAVSEEFCLRKNGRKLRREETKKERHTCQSMQNIAPSPNEN